ncbi:MAG: metallophosphoesterase family protein [Desulfobacterales bacterium]|nr:metallophosphoesterase family protein [Desulfobacterales bacterium]
MALGILSDTHGRLRPEALAALAGLDMIVHAGDVGGPDILAALSEIAPTVAVRGNMDYGAWSRDLREIEVVEAGEALLYVLHDLHRLDLSPAAAGFHAVVSGHTHRPSAEYREGVLFLNPGSVTHPRDHHPPSLAILDIRGVSLMHRLVWF